MARIDMALTNCEFAIPFEPEFASETSALFGLGWDSEFVFEDLNRRMNARPTPPGFRRRRIVGSCAGFCDNPNCNAPWDKQLGGCSAGCQETEQVECDTCKSNRAVRKSLKWATRARAFLQGYESHNGQAAFITFKLPKFALRPECRDEFEEFKSAPETTELFIQDRLLIARENLERQLNRRRSAGRPGLPVESTDNFFQHRPLIPLLSEEEFVQRVNAGAISTEDAAFEEAFEEHARRKAKRYVNDRFDSLVQLEAFRRGWIQAVVDTWRRYIPREVHKRGGFNYVCEDMLSSPAHFKSVTEKLPDDIEPERVLPHLLSHMVSLVEKRMREDGLPYQRISVIEQGSQGGYHLHMLLCCLPVEGRMDAIEKRMRYHMHRVLGNVHWSTKTWHPPSKRYVIKSWFERFPISDHRRVSQYLSKYVSKGWIDTRVRGSVGLALSDVARDMSLQKHNFVPDRDLTECWVPLYRARRVRGSDKSELYQVGIAYQSPYAALLESAVEVGSDTWLLLEFEDSRLFHKSGYLSAPKIAGMVLTAGPVASMLSAEFAVGIDTECNELSLVPPGSVAIPVENLHSVDDQDRRKFLYTLVLADPKNNVEFGSPDSFGDGDVSRQNLFLRYAARVVQKMESAWQDVHKSAQFGLLSLHRLRNELAARSPPDHHLNW